MPYGQGGGVPCTHKSHAPELRKPYPPCLKSPVVNPPVWRHSHGAKCGEGRPQLRAWTTTGPPHPRGRGHSCRRWLAIGPRRPCIDFQGAISFNNSSTSLSTWPQAKKGLLISPWGRHVSLVSPPSFLSLKIPFVSLYPMTVWKRGELWGRDETRGPHPDRLTQVTRGPLTRSMLLALSSYR